MSEELRVETLLASTLSAKYVRYFLPEVGVGALLDLLAVYAALARIVVIKDYLAFLLPALPLLSSLIHGLNLGRSTWWWINEGHVLYIRSLPVRHRAFLLLYLAWQLLLGFLPLSLLYYAAMVLIAAPPFRLYFVFISSTALFALMFSVGATIAAVVKDWFKISAFSELVQWGVTALTPTLYDLRFLTSISPTLGAVVASNPLTWLIQLARAAMGPGDLLGALALLLGSLGAAYVLCGLASDHWTE